MFHEFSRTIRTEARRIRNRGVLLVSRWGEVRLLHGMELSIYEARFQDFKVSELSNRSTRNL
jgi:hypothetical protein